MGRRKGKKPDRFQWFLRKEAEAYKSSQQSGRPRNGVTWFSVDRLGHVALFDSRETGNVPLTATVNIDGYDRLGVPESPLTILQCPEHLRWLIEKVHFGGAFRDTSKMFVYKYWKCI